MKWKCTLTYIRQQKSSTFHQPWWLFSVVVYSAWCSSNRLFSFCVVCVCERFLLLFVFFVSIDRLRALCKWCYSLRLMRVLCVCCVLSIPNHQIVVHILLLTMVRWCGCLPVFFGIMVGICYWTSFSNELSGNFGFCLSIDFDGMVCQWQWLVHWTKYKVLYLSRVAQLSAMNAEIRNGLIDMMAAI